MTNQIVICIPIELNSRQEIADALLDRYGTDYLFMGRNFQARTNHKSCQINICQSPDLAEAIEFAGQNKISPTTLEKIALCPQAIDLRSYDVGYSACLTMANFAQIFLNLGGIAVYVPSTGLAHEADKWLSDYNSKDVFDIYSLYVSLVEGDDIYYSCGMHNFGKADVALDITEDLGLAIYVMNVFNYYRLTESPILQDGHTFKPDIECPSYQIKLIEDEEHDIDSPMCNHYGRWLLKRN